MLADQADGAGDLGDGALPDLSSSTTIARTPPQKAV
jgi:hypothetical protein